MENNINVVLGGLNHRVSSSSVGADAFAKLMRLLDGYPSFFLFIVAVFGGTNLSDSLPRHTKLYVISAEICNSLDNASEI